MTIFAFIQFEDIVSAQAGEMQAFHANGEELLITRNETERSLLTLDLARAYLSARLSISGCLEIIPPRFTTTDAPRGFVGGPQATGGWGMRRRAAQATAKTISVANENQTAPATIRNVRMTNPFSRPAIRFLICATRHMVFGCNSTENFTKISAHYWPVIRLFMRMVRSWRDDAGAVYSKTDSSDGVIHCHTEHKTDHALTSN
jgi:hypothetical protein